MDGPHVLVGFDGSPAAGRALRWAATEASLRGVPLRVCHAWNWPYPAGPEGDEALQIVRGMGVVALEDGVRIARETVPGLDVRSLLSRGTAPAALLAASQGAELLVVGDRGIGSSPKTLLGAVTRSVLHEAPGPVAVVHDRDPHAKEPS